METGIMSKPFANQAMRSGDIRSAMAMFLEYTAAPKTSIHQALPAIKRHSVEPDDDARLMNQVRNIFSANKLVHPDNLTINVTAGQVVIKGHVEWNFQQDFMINTVKLIKGVIGVQLFMYAFE